MERRYYLIVILCLIISSCVGEDDEVSQHIEPITQDDTTHVEPTPTAATDTLSFDERPSWSVITATDPTQSSMTLTILLTGITVRGNNNTQWTFIPDESDLVAAFVHDECRGLTSPKVYDSTLAFLPVAVAEGDSPDDKLSVVLKYYSSKLHHIFTVNDNIIFTQGQSFGSPTNPLVFSWIK